MEKINLKELQNNYINNLCDRIFVLTLENGLEINIRFYKESMCHLMGLQHIYGSDRRYLGGKGYARIEREAITVKHLKAHNKSQYNFIKNRLLHFDEIIDVLKNGYLVRFSQEKVKKGTYITADFVLFKDNQKYLLNLFLIKELNTDTYAPKSFFVLSEEDDKTAYITNRPIKILARKEIAVK